MAAPVRVVVIAGAVLVTAVPAHGGLLNLKLDGTPDIFSAFIDVSYNAASDQLLVDGFALTLDHDGAPPPENIQGGLFSIDAIIDEFGQPVSGSLRIDGSVLGFGTTLLTGTLAEFGFIDGGGNLFEFVFIVTGGDLATPQFYGQPGTPVGVILHGANFGGSFQQDFANAGIGLADAAPVPAAPGLALLALAAARRTRRRRR